MNPKKIAIIGSGFSGLTVAWYLKSRGFDVEIFERENHSGGLIGTKKAIVNVETGANALLASQNVEKLFSDLNLQIIDAGVASKKRFIYKNGLKRFPINFFVGLHAFFNFIINYLLNKLAPEPNETASMWVGRCLNRTFDQNIASAALQGIYGTTTEFLDAELIFTGFLKNELRPKLGLKKGSVSTANGMQELIDSLKNELIKKNVRFHFQETLDLGVANSFDAQIIATSIFDAALALKSAAPIAAAKLNLVPMLPLSTVTLGFKNKKSVNGFGCLFPKDEKFNTLGVLFNSDIFPNRGQIESETWILNNEIPGGEFAACISDRQRLLKNTENPDYSNIIRYQKAIPLYGAELKKFLMSDFFVRTEAKSTFEILKSGCRLNETKKPTYLTGNYLGALGLTKILDYNDRLAERVWKDLK